MNTKRSVADSNSANLAGLFTWGVLTPLWLFASGLILLVSTSHAALIAYEPFNYPPGAINNGTATTATGTPTTLTGGGFSGTWFAGGVGTTIVGGLTYSGLPTANNALQWSTSVPYQGENLATQLLPASTPTVYISFLYNAPSFTANKSGFAVDNGAGANIGYYMGMTASGTFGVATVVNGSGTVLGTAAGTISFNTTYFIVVKFVKDSAGTYYQSGSIWINPTPGASEPAPSGTFTGTYTAMNKIADFLTALGGSTVRTDEIRLGTTWADVTPASVSPPATPTGLQVDSSGANTVSLSWTASAGSPTSYNVKRATSSVGPYTTVGTATAPTVAFIDSVTGGATYFYVVSAVSGGGESTNTSFVSATPTLGVPNAPTGLAASPGNNQVALSWTAPAVGSPTSYNVLRSTTSGLGYSPITTPGAQTTTSYTDLTAVNGTPYFYVVQAVNAAGASANSSQVSATPADYINVYEPFNYASITTGTAVTGTGMSGNWTAGAGVTTPAGLAFTANGTLPSANNRLSCATGGDSRTFASFGSSSALSGGTKYISFLASQAGNNGGNLCGIYFDNGATSLFLGSGASPGSFTLSPFSVATSGSGAFTSLAASTFTGSYNTVALVVMKIDFNTSGANDTVTIYVNPAANASAPGVAASYTLTTFDVGNISGFGLRYQGGGLAFNIDELRTGTTYASVVGGSSGPSPLAPVITSLSPVSGLTNGGTGVTITGSNFLAGVTVKFGPNFATGISLNSSSNITATTPAGFPGAVNVVVQNTNTLSATNLNAFTYLLPPPPPPVQPTIVPGSVVMTSSNLNFVWLGGTNTTSVLLTSTNVAPGSTWTPVATNLFGADGLSTNSLPVNPGEPKRFYGLSIPSDIVTVLAPTGLQTIPSGSTNAIGLSWTGSASAGVIGYRLYYGLNSAALTNSVDVGNVTSAIISGLTSGQNYFLAVVALTTNGQSLAVDATISAQTDANASIIALFNASTPLEPATTVDTPTARYTYIADRVRDRHAREANFHIYDHYLSWYWEQRVANIQIIDRVGKVGQPQTITFNYTTQDLLNPAEFRTFFGGVSTVAQYNNNQIATFLGSNPSATPGETDYNYTATINQNANFGNRALLPGDRVEIEISQFLNAPRHGRNNYYGTVLLYIVGQGIVPWAQGNDLGFNGGIIGIVNQSLDSYPLSTNAWLGGLTTLPYQYSDEPEHRFKQTAGNIAPTNGLPFMLGRRLHHTDFGDGSHTEPNNPIFPEHVGQLGPKFIARNCVECHVNNGRALPATVGTPLTKWVFKVGSDANDSPHPVLGSVFQPQSTSGPGEGSVSVASYTTTSGQYGDATSFSLQKPNYAFSGTTPTFFSARIAPQLVGLGLLEAVSESTIMALADPSDTNADGISGRIQTVIDPVTAQLRLGRFGYKGVKARVSHQVAGALNTDMGVTTSVFPILDGETNSVASEISDADLDKMTRYVALLGVGARRDLSDAQALQGEQLFATASCIKCHTPTLTTSPYHPNTELRSQTIRPYTDLLLHDMGPGLADNMGEGVATGSEWRTPPLWNIGLTAGVSGGEAYLHDGRARTLEEAILWHGGEAEASKEAFRTMSAADRAALIKFLKSL